MKDNLMKQRYIGIGAAIALLCLVSVLFKPKESAWGAHWDRKFIMLNLEWPYLPPAQIKQVAQDLAASQDPQKLAFAAILAQKLDSRFDKHCAYAPFLTQCSAEKSPHALPQETLDGWRKMALEKAAPDDVWTLSMLATFGPWKSDSAERIRNKASIHWQQAELTNLVPLLLLYQPALSIDEFFEQAKTRHQFVGHNYAIRRWMYQTLLQQLPDAEKSIVAEIVNIMVDTTLSGNRLLFKICRNNPPERASVKWQQCQSIAQILLHQDVNFLARIDGISILKNLANSDAEKQALDEEMVDFHWLIREGVFHLERVSNIYERSLYVLQDANINNKQQEMERLLLRYGLPLKPE